MMNRDRTAWVNGLSDQALVCRDSGVGHSWEPWTVEVVGGRYEEELICRRCESRKIRTVTRKGVIVRTRYLYPAEFLRRGLGRMTRDENAAIRARGIARRIR